MKIDVDFKAETVPVIEVEQGEQLAGAVLHVRPFLIV